LPRLENVLELLALPFFACLVLTAIHVYLGFHVLARGVIFVDLTLAQVAALGLTVAILAGHPVHSEGAYWYALAFAIGGGILFALTRVQEERVPQEAIIGIIYAVSAALAVLVVDRAPQGAEHIKQLLVGSILSVSLDDVLTLAVLYAAIGALHWAVRRPMLQLSLDPAAAAGRRVLPWDIFFYATFALVVTSSVRVAGVLLVFSYLVVPAAIGALLAHTVAARLWIAWGVGAAVSAAGLAASWAWDLPTGAAVVSAFGAAIALVALGLGLRRAARAVRAHGAAALAPVLVVLCAAAALAGALLVAFPRMDHLWLDALERGAPQVQELFLTPAEVEARRDALESVVRAEAELARLRAMQQDVRWGTRTMDAEQEERLRQYIAGRSEISAGDQLALRTLRFKARERQRFPVGVPLLLAGIAGAVFFARRVRPRDAGGTGL
jgi:zinc/manganese transport system permease protein